MKTLTKSEASAIDPAKLREMGVHIRTTDDGVIVYQDEAEIPAMKAEVAVDPPDYLTMIAKAGTLAELKTALVGYLKSR